MAKIGRPRLPKNAKRAERVVICLLSDERARLEAEARRRGLHVGRLIRERAIG